MSSAECRLVVCQGVVGQLQAQLAQVVISPTMLRLALDMKSSSHGRNWIPDLAPEKTGTVMDALFD